MKRSLYKDRRVHRDAGAPLAERSSEHDPARLRSRGMPVFLVSETAARPERRRSSRNARARDVMEGDVVVEGGASHQFGSRQGCRRGGGGRRGGHGCDSRPAARDIGEHRSACGSQEDDVRARELARSCSTATLRPRRDGCECRAAVAAESCSRQQVTPAQRRAGAARDSRLSWSA